MKKLLTISSVGLALPLLAFAAYNDVTLGSSLTFIQIDGQTIGISGDANVVEQVVVSTGSITLTLDTNSEVTVTSPSSKKLEHNAANAHVVSSVCESGNSQIHLKGASDDVSVTITPKNTTCPEGGGGGGSGSSGGGGGGGGGSTQTVVTPVTVPANATIAQLQAQLQVLLAQLNALQSGAAAVPGQVTAAKIHITQILSKGSRGNSVKGLQQFLNNRGFIISSSGAGSPGNETDTYGSLTEKAVGKFQEQYNIAKPGDPGYGRVGPKTRAKINELSGN